MKKTTQNKLKRKEDYYVNFDYKFFTNLTRRQVAFVVLLHELQKANLTMTNREFGSYLGIHPDTLNKMYKNINSKFPNLIAVTQEDVNLNGRILSKTTEHSSIGRVLRLTRPLHVKGETYINLPMFVLTKRSTFLSSNELKILGYLKALPQNSFKGYLRVIGAKTGTTYGIIQRALLKLAKLKAIMKRSLKIKHKIKNIYYTINLLSIPSSWSYKPNESDKAKLLNINQKSDHEPDNFDWQSIAI